jgi:hypothetical protein
MTPTRIQNRPILEGERLSWGRHCSHISAGFQAEKFANGLEIGAAGYAYQQLTPDSGSGAKLGPFKGRVFGVGPHLVYNTVLMHRPVLFNFRNYQEFDAENRFEGNVTTFTTTVKF